MDWPDEEGKRKEDKPVERSSFPALFSLVGEIPGTYPTCRQEHKSLARSTSDTQRMVSPESFDDSSFLLIGISVEHLTYSGMVDLSDIKNRLCPDLQRYSRGYN
jgi:hypothetical protein